MAPVEKNKQKCNIQVPVGVAAQAVALTPIKQEWQLQEPAEATTATITVTQR